EKLKGGKITNRPADYGANNDNDTKDGGYTTHSSKTTGFFNNGPKSNKKLVPLESLTKLKKVIFELENFLNISILIAITILSIVIKSIIFIYDESVPFFWALFGIYLSILIIIGIYGLHYVSVFLKNKMTIKYKYMPKKIEGFEKISLINPTNFGAGLILFGIVTLTYYYISFILIIEGILIIIYNICNLNNIFQIMNKTDYLDYKIAAQDILNVVIRNLSKFGVNLTLLSIIMGAPNILFVFIKFPDYDISPIIFAVLSTFMYKYLKNRLIYSINRTSLNNIDNKTLAFGVVWGILTMPYNSSGVVCLLISVLIFIYKDLNKDINDYARKHHIIAINIDNLRKEIHSLLWDFYDTRQGINVADNKNVGISYDNTKELTPLKAPSSLKPADNNNAKDEAVANISPSTEGVKPLDDNSRDLNPHEAQVELGTPMPNDNKDSELKPIKEYLDRTFAIISDKVRQKIIRLDIPEKEKEEIIKEFVNLSEEQQLKYLEELENVNSKLPQEMILRVENLKIKKEYKKKIIEQLELISKEERNNFLDYLESQNNV
ncbi:MAG: hypothetical protein ACTSXF_05055, partial [Promethearchaeota archaeon]